MFEHYRQLFRCSNPVFKLFPLRKFWSFYLFSVWVIVRILGIITLFFINSTILAPCSFSTTAFLDKNTLNKQLFLRIFVMIHTGKSVFKYLNFEIQEMYKYTHIVWSLSLFGGSDLWENLSKNIQYNKPLKKWSMNGIFMCHNTWKIILHSHIIEIDNKTAKQ